MVEVDPLLTFEDAKCSALSATACRATLITCDGRAASVYETYGILASYLG
jgi:hypothetical protein